LEPGDVIVELDGKRVRDAESLREALAEVQPGGLVLAEVVRDGQRRAIGLQHPEPAPAKPAPETTAPASPAPPRPSTPPVVVVVPAPSPPSVTIVPPSGTPAIGGDYFFGYPPAFSAPGLSEVPGATFAPPAGAAAFAAPQLPGLSQPYAWR